MSNDSEKSDSIHPRKRKSRKTCVVFGCGSISGNCQDLSFHRFPKKNEAKVQILNSFGNKEKISRLKAWLIALKFGNRKIKQDMVVCSKHFEKGDYILPTCVDIFVFLLSSIILIRIDHLKFFGSNGGFNI